MPKRAGEVIGGRESRAGRGAVVRGEMSSTDSESDSGREEEEEEEEEAQRSSEGGEEEKNEEEDEEEEENGHASQADESLAVVHAGGSGRRSSSAANAGLPKSTSLTTLAFPISRVRRLVKSEVDVQWVGVEAGFLIAKAAELFLEKFVEDAFDKMTDDERTVLSYKDLASHVSSSDRFDFLADFVPETVPASTALSAKGQGDRPHRERLGLYKIQ